MLQFQSDIFPTVHHITFAIAFLNGLKCNVLGQDFQGRLYLRRSFEPVHEISSNVVCATSKASDQPAHMRSLITAFASRLNIL